MRSRASDKARRSPRLVAASAWISSRMTVSRSANRSVAVGVAEEQRQLLRRRHQDVWRRTSLPRPSRHRRVAGARLGADRQLHLRDGRRQVARHVDGQRLQRRDIERVQTPPAVGARTLRQAHEAGQEAGERLARPGRRDQQGRAPLPGSLDQRQLMRPRGPPARGEPGGKRLGQSRHDGRGSPARAGGAPWRPGLVSSSYADTLRSGYRNGSATMLRPGCPVTRAKMGRHPAARHYSRGERPDGPQHLPGRQRPGRSGSPARALDRRRRGAVDLGHHPRQHLLPVQHPACGGSTIWASAPSSPCSAT